LIEDTKSRYTSNGLFWVSVFLAVLGLIDAGYLTWIKLTGSAVACSNVGNCELVNNSRFADIQGVPIALLGASGYLMIVILLGLEWRNRAASENTRLAVFGLTLVGTLYSAYLTYIELGVLHAICPYCLASAVIMTCLFALSITRLRRPWVDEA
jgi:uncharacterized membrane protein